MSQVYVVDMMNLVGRGWFIPACLADLLLPVHAIPAKLQGINRDICTRIVQG